MDSELLEYRKKITLPGNSVVRPIRDVSYTATIGEDSERDVRDARRLRQGQKEARGDTRGYEGKRRDAGRRESRAVRGRDVLGWPPS